MNFQVICFKAVEFSELLVPHLTLYTQHSSESLCAVAPSCLENAVSWQSLTAFGSGNLLKLSCGILSLEGEVCTMSLDGEVNTMDVPLRTEHSKVLLSVHDRLPVSALVTTFLLL